MIGFRNLHPEEIRVRINNCTEKGATYLLYKDARCDQDILDETVGAENWQRKHEEHKGNLFCAVGINANYQHPELAPAWVWKEDCGAESNTEKEKGEASDSFKRACVNFGIGRELYTKIHIFIPIKTRPSGRTNKAGKPIYEPVNPFEKFHVSAIECDKKKITSLEISDSRGVVAFRWKANAKAATPPTPAPLPPATAYNCEICHAEIRDLADKEGKRISANRYAQASIDKYGKIVCQKCLALNLV